MNHPRKIEIPEPEFSRFLFADTRFSWVWLVLRIYVGYEWITAGWQKVTSATWTGAQAGAAIKGFFMNALQASQSAHPDVSFWYAWFLHHVAIPHAVTFSYFIAYGELAIGIVLVLGAFTGIAAFCGAFLNLNYLFAGTLSVNPLLLLIQLFIVLAWRNAGWIGIDRWLLPALGVPWQPGRIFKKS